MIVLLVLSASISYRPAQVRAHLPIVLVYRSQWVSFAHQSEQGPPLASDCHMLRTLLGSRRNCYPCVICLRTDRLAGEHLFPDMNRTHYHMSRGNKTKNYGICGDILKPNTITTKIKTKYNKTTETV